MKMTNRQPRGFMFADAVLGLMIIATAGILFVSVMHQITPVSQKISASREARTIAADVLLGMQTGVGHQSDDKTEVKIIDLSDTPAPAGWRWVRVEVATSRARATLTGIVRRGQ